jgi:hypothetical protein
LIVKHKVTDGLGEPLALPAALETSGVLALRIRYRRAHGLDRVGRGTQLVRSDMRDRCCLSSRETGVSRSTAKVPRRRVGVAGGRPGFGHRDLATCPGASELDRAPRPLVVRSGALEVVEHMLRARRSPHGEAMVVVVLERPASTDRDQPRISNIAQDHSSSLGHPFRGRAGLRASVAGPFG